MKKFLFLIVLSLVFVGCKSKKDAVSIATFREWCNPAPGWGKSLGKISLGNETTVSNDAMTQIWSDPVVATSCDKTSFRGGVYASAIYYPDCRPNPGYNGHLFSWCAVLLFGEQLCPKPWRVPTKEDFINLDIILGGIGEKQFERAHLDRYINVWKSEFGGYALGSGSSGLLHQGWIGG
jgi:hypothetical protein